MYIGQLYIHIMYCQHISKHPKKQTVQPWFETMNLGGPNSFHKHPVGVPKDRRQHQPALAQWSFFIAGVCAKAVTLLQRLEDETTSTSPSRGKDLLWRLWSRSGRCHPAMSNARNEALGPRISDAEMTKDLVIVGSSSSLGYPLVNFYITMENHYF